MRIVCVYHGIDLDGWMSAAIVKRWFQTSNETLPAMVNIGTKDLPVWLYNQSTLSMFAYNYGQEIPDLSKYDKVIMCDISFPKDVMLNLFDKLDKNFIWIDHHVSAIKDIIGNDYDYLDDVDNSTLLSGLRNRYYAACELTWDFFFPDDDVPNIVRLLGMYDSFRHKGTDEEQKVLEFQYGARAFISNYEDAYVMLNEELSERTSSIVKRLLDQGISIYQYLCAEAKQAYKNGFPITLGLMTERQGPWPYKVVNTDTGETTTSYNIIEHYKFICVNKERFNPINFGIDYHKEGYDGAACFHYGNGKWNFSLYNDNGLVDCSKIAKQFGGGGHAGAAGFVSDDWTMMKIIGHEPQMQQVS